MAGALGLPYFPHPSRVRAGWGDRLKTEESLLEALFRPQGEKRKEAEKSAKRRVQCGAKTRKGTPCRAMSEPGKRRCRFHGGMSTGAKTVRVLSSDSARLWRRSSKLIKSEL
nr:HGGxSTG domain-containing protein [Tropicimonas sp. IMCC6043]